MEDGRPASTTFAHPRLGPLRFGLTHALALRLRDLLASFQAALHREIAWRRPALWLPVAAGAGVIANLAADRDPSLLAATVALFVFAALAFALRARPVACALALGLAAFAAGHASMSFRVARAAAPVVARFTIVNVTGFVEQVDLRREGSRLVLRLTSADGIADDALPRRVRLTTRRAPGIEAGAHVALKARLLPPARAALPGGYDFARDAYFAGIGGVGNVLGKIESRPTDAAPLSLRIAAAIDRARNALVERIAARLPGDTGAIAAAMVTGKRDLLTGDAKELIREAGIFHIITISGIQMTLVAGIFFVGLRRLLALSRTLALDYPIKKWAAGFAIAGAIAYDILTGSRVGTERALIMTIVLLAAVLLDRPSLSMRNLAIAAAFVIAVEPEAVLGASFQLSFAAVAALVAVWEARSSRYASDADAVPLRAAPGTPALFTILRDYLAVFAHGKIGSILVATACATAATASFMAYNFHELSPYVLIGNPLTLAMIEFFAVPAALLGTLLYPFGLDGPVWSYLGLGIDLVIGVARWIASAPGATVHLPAFNAAAIAFLALAVLSAVIWRTALLRATAIPFAAIGLWLAASAPTFDVAVAATGETAAVRGADGILHLLAKRSGTAFTAEQWLRADADGRLPVTMERGTCDDDGCVGRLADGRAVALVIAESAFLRDCERAYIVVTSLYAPSGCGAAIVLDRRSLAATGAVTLDLGGASIVERHARSVGEDRPWSRAPRASPRRPGLAQPEDVARDGETTTLSERVD